MIWFKQEVSVDSKEEQADAENDPDEEEMDNVNLDNDRGHHWRMVFEDNDGGVDDAKEFLHSKRWYVYMNVKKKLVKGWYLVEVVGHDGNKVFWEVVSNHVVEEKTDHDEIGLFGFDFNFFDEYDKGVSREGLSELPYLLMLIKLWPGN